MSTILIVDDDAQLRRSFSKLLQDDGYTVENAGTSEECLDRVRKGGVDLVIQDVRMPGVDGIETFRRLREFPDPPPVIVMTAHGTMETAVEATRLGAFDYVLKPFDIPAMLELIQKALASQQQVPEEPPQEDDGDAEMSALLGNAPAMQAVYKAIGRAAPTDATVLIRGESGTGKELAARAIYQYSAREAGPFEIVNCVAIPETLLESELFGYEKGAFTGAASRRVGKIEQANRGTVFFDEVGDMPLTIQAKVLRLLQEKQIQRLGGGAPIPVDVRIIAATNRNLEEAVREGSFREDLYFRLKVVTIAMPRLAERQEDIPLLAEQLMVRHAKAMELPNPGISPEAQATLTHYHWPGNVRELSNCMQKLVIFSHGAPVQPAEVEHALAQYGDARLTHSDPAADANFKDWARHVILHSEKGTAYEEAMDAMSTLLVTNALEMTEGNRTRAARLLGVSRPTLQAKIEKHKITLGTRVKASGPGGE